MKPLSARRIKMSGGAFNFVLFVGVDLALILGVWVGLNGTWEKQIAAFGFPHNTLYYSISAIPVLFFFVRGIATRNRDILSGCIIGYFGIGILALYVNATILPAAQPFLGGIFRTAWGIGAAILIVVHLYREFRLNSRPQVLIAPVPEENALTELRKLSPRLGFPIVFGFICFFAPEIASAFSLGAVWEERFDFVSFFGILVLCAGFTWWVFRLFVVRARIEHHWFSAWLGTGCVCLFLLLSILKVSFMTSMGAPSSVLLVGKLTSLSAGLLMTFTLLVNSIGTFDMCRRYILKDADE